MSKPQSRSFFETVTGLNTDSFSESKIQEFRNPHYDTSFSKEKMWDLANQLIKGMAELESRDLHVCELTADKVLRCGQSWKLNPIQSIVNFYQSTY